VNLLISDAGKTKCITARGPAALVALAAAPAVRGSADAAFAVARAFEFISLSDAGKAACIAAGARAALAAFATCPAVQGSAEATHFVNMAMRNIS
jgi:hypothetical protein